MGNPKILSIDAGTTGIKVSIYDQDANIYRQAGENFTQYYPRPGWVEHDAEEIWGTTRRLLLKVCDGMEPGEVVGIGITNQRETTVVWDRATGKPSARAIVWQCRRSQPQCERLRKEGHTEMLFQKTGLVPDAYFSGTKLQWMLENDAELREKAAAGKLVFGTIDTWLIWNLSGGSIHATDPTNASRTLLYNIEEKQWDADLLELMDVPPPMLPEVRPSSGILGETDPGLLGTAIPISGVAGDQQAALAGQGGVDPMTAKSTYGTGCFLLVNTGGRRVCSQHGLLTTLAWGREGQPVYALEGSVFIAGAVVQWLRDELGLIATSADSEPLAASVPDTGGVYLVPAFTGLGAPFWDMNARGGITGLTRGSNRAHIVRAALESIAYQTRDLIAAVESDLDMKLNELRVDGGATANDFLMQFQADILGIPLDRPKDTETTSLGAAFLAGLGCGFWADWEEVLSRRVMEKKFEPRMPAGRSNELYQGWLTAVKRMMAGET